MYYILTICSVNVTVLFHSFLFFHTDYLEDNHTKENNDILKMKKKTCHQNV